jgi:sulfur-oxidizing protein SoxA
MGTLHRRFGGCNGQVRAKPFKAQSVQYRELEYFLAYMSNGLELNGPGARK